ncbi:MAG: hypothetical protein MUC50_12415 [Myxococcota bacterium]|jgi:hypothetical protein|nr:hypothetical protein [Myxococcota bacterium]
MSTRTVPTREINIIHSYPIPEKENVQCFRIPPDARGGDTYQIVVDVEATPEECFDILTDFDLMQKSSSVIIEIKTLKKDQDNAYIAMRCKPEVDTGVFHYRYVFDRKNTQFLYWMHDYEGDKPVYYAINVETRILNFGKISRVILTETYLVTKNTPYPDAVAIFTGIGHDMLNRIKTNKKSK